MVLSANFGVAWKGTWLVTAPQKQLSVHHNLSEQSGASPSALAVLFLFRPKREYPADFVRLGFQCLSKEAPEEFSSARRGKAPLSLQ